MIGNDLKKRNTGTIVINQAVVGGFKRARRMHQFACVLFKMYPFDSHGVGLSVVPDDFQETVFTKRAFILGDLIPSGQIRLKVVFTSKARMSVDRAIEGQTRTNGKFHGLFIQNRKCTRLPGTDRTYMTIRGFFITDRTVTEKLSLCFKLYMCFKADNDVVIH